MEDPAGEAIKRLGQLHDMQRHLVDELDTLNASIEEAVANARQLRVTWREIGQALGITAQSAQRRFTEEARQAASERQRASRNRSPASRRNPRLQS